MRCLRRTFNPLILVPLTVLGCVLLPRNLFHRESVVVEVEAARGWQGTGVHLAAGDVVTITHIGGAWSPWPGETFDAIGSGGDPRCRCNVMQAVSHAALIGRVGTSNPFLVGGAFQHRIGESGTLELRINDVDLHDNSGKLKVLVEVN